jgi:hypothetical protein
MGEGRGVRAGETDRDRMIHWTISKQSEVLLQVNHEVQVRADQIRRRCVSVCFLLSRSRSFRPASVNGRL